MKLLFSFLTISFLLFSCEKEYQHPNSTEPDLIYFISRTSVSYLNRTASIIESKLNEIEVKKTKLEERFIDGEVPLELSNKYIEKFKQESDDLRQQIGNHQELSSNLEIAIKKGFKIAENIDLVWASSDFDHKTKLQKIIFPEGIAYERQNHRVRTFRVNTIFSLIADIVRVSEQKKSVNR